MRMLCLITWLALASGCSAFSVRCDSHLRPINPRQPPPGLQQSATGAVVREQVKP
jgi:hypothetical protein